MSLDFIFVKARGPVADIEDLDGDTSFGLDDYKRLAERLFPGMDWEGTDHTVITVGDASLEIIAHESSLAVWIRGLNADPHIMLDLAKRCRPENVYIVDVQSSELVTAESASQMDEYHAWHRRVLSEYE